MSLDSIVPAGAARRRPPGGSRKGRPNKTTAAVKDALALAFEGMGGVPQLEAWAKDNRTEFYKLWAKLLPVQLAGHDGGQLDITVRWDQS